MLNSGVCVGDMDVREILGRVVGAQHEMELWFCDTSLELDARAEVLGTLELVREVLEQARLASALNAVRRQQKEAYDYESPQQ